MLTCVLEHLLTGGRHRTPYTLPSLVLSLLSTMRRATEGVLVTKLCQTSSKTIGTLATDGHVDTALRLLLQAALVVDTLTHEFHSRETLVYAFLEEVSGVHGLL